MKCDRHKERWKDGRKRDGKGKGQDVSTAGIDIGGVVGGWDISTEKADIRPYGTNVMQAS